MIIIKNIIIITTMKRTLKATIKTITITMKIILLKIITIIKKIISWKIKKSMIIKLILQ